VGDAPVDDVSVWTLLRCPKISQVLGSLLLANAAISSLESSTARYFMDTFGFSIAQVSLFYMITSVPSCAMSGIAGPIGNRLGRGGVMTLGLFLQGFFTLLGPKDSLHVEVVSFFCLGIGMGAIDGTAPALLSEAARDEFGGTGKVYVMQNVATQSGFVVGPVLGNALVEARGFAFSMLALGAALVAYAPLFARPAWSRAKGGAPSAQKPLLGA